MELTFLGTGAGIPSKERNVTAVVLNLLAEINELWLFDCGEATQHQLLHTNIKPRKITKIFITHLHGDHLFGLPGLLSSRSFQGGEEGLIIYGPQGIQDFVETSLKVSGSRLTYPIKFVELTGAGKVFHDKHFNIDCVELDHGIQSFGYRIQEKDRLGKLDVQKLQEIGIPPGPIYSEIKNHATTTLDDGTILYRKDFLGEPKKGKTIAIFGDTRYVPKHSSFIQNADVLVHEATFDRNKSDLANSYYHSTTEQVATFAKDSCIGTLLLTHISSRYQKGEEKRLLQEVKDIFPNTYIVYDFFTYKLKN